MNQPKDQNQPQIKWYLRPVAVIVIILLAGPFGLPLAWMSPAFKKSHKIVITILVTVFTIWLAKASIDLYNMLLNEIREIQKVLNP